MYRITDIDRNNLEVYQGFLGDDVSENIGREYYRAIAAVSDIDDKLCGCMVWVLKNIAQEIDNESHIVFIKCGDKDVFDAMMEGYGERIKDEQVVRSTAFVPLKEAKLLKAMLKDAGFGMRLTESNVINVRLSEMSQMPLIEKLRNKKMPDSITTLNQISIRAFRRGIAKCVNQGRYGLCEDLESLGVRWFEDDISSVSTGEDGINGLFLFHVRPSGVVAAQLLVCLDQSFKKTLPMLMCRFVTAMEEKYGPDTMIELDRHNEQSLLLSEKLLPRGFGIPIYEGSRTEI